MKTEFRTRAVLGGAALLTAAALAASGRAGAVPADPPANKALDPKAMSMLRGMSDFLGGQQKFSVHTDGTLEAVRDDGQKVEFDHSSQISVKRPNQLRADRVGEMVSASLYDDGKTITLYGKENGYYAQAPAQPTLEATLDNAREKLGLETAASDLIYKNSYDVLTEDVVGSKYIGLSTVRGVPCHHLAFQGHETDWQIWIADGKQPVPCKFVVTSKKMKMSPEFRTELSQWNFSTDIADDTFRFVPPSGAKQIDFLGPAPEKAKPPSSKTPKGGPQ